MTHNENQMRRLSEPGVTAARGRQRTCAGPGGHAVGGRHGHAVEPQQRQKLLRWYRCQLSQRSAGAGDTHLVAEQQAAGILDFAQCEAVQLVQVDKATTTVARLLLGSAKTPCAALVRCVGASGPSAMCFACGSTLRIVVSTFCLSGMHTLSAEAVWKCWLHYKETLAFCTQTHLQVRRRSRATAELCGERLQDERAGCTTGTIRR